jgi:hypothetical protein
VNVEAVARPWSLRAVPWLAWLLLVVGVLYVVRGLLPPSFSPLSSLAGAGPIFFAAAVVYMNPPDRRFRWAALALAIPPIVLLLAHWIPIIWPQVVPGDWKNAVPLLEDLGSMAREVATPIGLVGLFLLGFALGGVRTFLSVVILAAGVLIALADLTWFFAHPVEELPMLQAAKSVIYPMLNVLGWAFVFAAALESLRSLTLVGAGLVVSNVVISAVLLWWTIGPDANFDLLSLTIAGPSVLGWLAMTAGALRGELNDAAVAPRSRAGRGSGVPRPAG